MGGRSAGARGVDAARLADQAGQVESAEAFRVGEDVDLGDLVVADGHAEDGEGLAVQRDEEPRGRR